MWRPGARKGGTTMVEGFKVIKEKTINNSYLQGG